MAREPSSLDRNPVSYMHLIPTQVVEFSGRSAWGKVGSMAGSSGDQPPTSRTSTWPCPILAALRFQTVRGPFPIQRPVVECLPYAWTTATASGTRPRHPADHANAAVPPSLLRSAPFPVWPFLDRLTDT